MPSHTFWRLLKVKEMEEMTEKDVKKELLGPLLETAPYCAIGGVSPVSYNTVPYSTIRAIQS